MKYEQLEEKVIQWAKDRKIIPNATPTAQLLKFFSEAGELSAAITDHSPERATPMQTDTKAAAETRARKGCGFVHRLVRPLWRACCDGRYSTCGSRDLHELDWSNWWQDGGYIHVRAYTWDEGETWHRVFPRPVRNRPRLRLAVRDGRPFWIFDGPNRRRSKEGYARNNRRCR